MMRLKPYCCCGGSCGGGSGGSGSGAGDGAANGAAAAAAGQSGGRMKITEKNIPGAAICWCDGGCGDDMPGEKVTTGCDVTY